MKLIDAIRKPGNPFAIPDCSRDDLPEFFKQLGFTTGVEIGVFAGENLEKYCQAGLTMTGVDPWASCQDYKTSNREMEKLYQLTIKRLLPYPNCRLIRKMSMDALNEFPKRSLDFVYIDGNHNFDQVAMDLVKWSDKVRRGGIIAGHDYYDAKGYRPTRHVAHVVDAFVKSYDINNWYLIGQKNPAPSEKVDESSLSFLFFKHW